MNDIRTMNKLKNRPLHSTNQKKMSNQDKRETQISKSLSYLLRHAAIKEKLPIDSNGYIPLDVLLQHNRLKSVKCTRIDIDRVVANNNKKRFHLKEENGKTLICATQGHSITAVTPAEEVLEQVATPGQLPSKLVHGTNFTNLMLILESGSIKRMNRNHVHLSPGVTGIDSAVVSGMRNSSTVAIYLKLDIVLERLKLYRSLNNVYLTPDDIPLDLFDKVILRCGQNNHAKVEEVSTMLQQKNIPFTLI